MFACREFLLGFVERPGHRWIGVRPMVERIMFLPFFQNKPQKTELGVLLLLLLLLLFLIIDS